MVFSGRNIGRVRGEVKLIKDMWAAKTTVRDLRNLAERGGELPKVCILAGRLNADGPAVAALTPQVPALRSMVGSIKQRQNFLAGVADDALLYGRGRLADSARN